MQSDLLPSRSEEEVTVTGPRSSSPDRTDLAGKITSRLTSHHPLVRSGLILLLSLLIELFIWNSPYWSFDRDMFPLKEIALPYQQQLQRNALAVLPDNPNISLSNLNMPIRSLELEGYGGSYRVTGTVLATSEAHAFKPQRISTFYLASGLNQDIKSPAQDYQKTVVKFDLSERVNDLILALDADTIGQGMVFTRITLNPDPEFNFSVIRVLLMVLGLALGHVTLCSRLYQHQLSLNSRAYRLLNHGLFGGMVLFACGIFAAYHPSVVNNMGFKPVALGFFPYTTPEHTVLQPIPTTPEALGNNDPYVQLAHALLVKHQLNLDLWVDPALSQLNNVYDRTERDSKKTQYYWDHAFYNGKYFCYYGLAPIVLIYAPIYFLTGLIPGEALAIFMAALWALLGLHVLSGRLMSLFCSSCNTVLFVVTRITMFMTSFIFFLQTQFVFYCQPYLLAIAFTCISLSCALSLWFRPCTRSTGNRDQDAAGDKTVPAEAAADDSTAAKAAAGAVAKAITADGSDAAGKETVEHKLHRLIRQRPGKTDSRRTQPQSQPQLQVQSAWNLSQMAAMLICGLSVVLVVMSRPLLLSYLVAGVGLIYGIYLFKIQQSLLNKTLNSLCLFVPVLSGAAVVCAYNYARFDSIFEFGQFRQLTVDDVGRNTLNMAPEYLKTMALDILFRNIEFNSAFPFVGSNLHGEANPGQNQFISDHFGLMNIPYFWGMLLLPVIWGITTFASTIREQLEPAVRGRLGLFALKFTLSFWYVLIVLLVCFTIYNAGWNQRYIGDMSFLAAIIPFLSVMQLKFTWQSLPERLFYLGWTGICLVSCVLMFFLTLNSGSITIEVLNPRLFIALKEIFDPLSFNL